jgi:FkbM family methyltransferase
MNTQKNLETTSLPLLLSWLQPVEFPHKLGICERLFGHKLKTKGICWIQTGAGIPWKLDLSNPTHRWVIYGKYEGAAFINWAKSFLPSNGVVVDSGASIGQMLLYLSQYVPTGKVLAFEPYPAAIEWLQECLDFHRSLPVELISCGLGNEPGQVYLEDTGEASGHGACSKVSRTANLGIPIQVTRLEDELLKRSISKVNLWCLDIEGYELPALKGAESLLKQQSICALYIELSDLTGGAGHKEAIQDFMAHFGYKAYQLNSASQPYIPIKWSSHSNGLFLPQ